MNKFNKIIEEMGPLAQKILLGDNEKMKKLAANGIVIPPPPKNELISIMFFLQYDSNEEIATSAKEKFVKLPENIIIEALKGSLHQYVIAGCYRYLTKQEKQNVEIFKAIIKHQNFKFDYIFKQLKDLNTSLKSYLAEALSFIAPYPKVMAFLVESEISKAQKQKILDFAERNNIQLNLKDRGGLKDLSGTSRDESLTHPTSSLTHPTGSLTHPTGSLTHTHPDSASHPSQEGNTKSTHKGEANDPTSSKDKETPSPTTEEILSNEELGISEKRSKKYDMEGMQAEKVMDERKSLARLVNEMNIADKIKLAMKGNMEARGLLIKQSNRLIVEGVIRNPMITEQEVVKFSADKNIHRDVIKYISNNRAWLRKYNIKMNVVLNPKTPTGRAVKLLTTLRYNDIKKIAKMKGITSALRRAAMDFVDRQEKKKNKKK